MKRTILLLCVSVLLLGLCACGEAAQQAAKQDGTNPGTSESPEQDEMAPEVSESQEQNKTEPNMPTGETIYMGTWEQDNDLTNGKELIQWDVVTMDGDRALVVSQYAIEARAFHEADEAATWEECSLRRWLNESFLQEAFTDAERTCILESVVKAEDNPEYGTDGGNDTVDRVFVLSASEYNTYYPKGTQKGYPPTAYAEANGAFAYTSGACMVWLRNPGKIPNSACFLFATAGVNAEGGYIDSSDISVCPAMWIDYIALVS